MVRVSRPLLTAATKPAWPLPNIEINLLQHVLCLTTVIQDTEADAKKLRRGLIIDEAQRGLVAGGDPAERRGELSAPWTRGSERLRRATSPSARGSLCLPCDAQKTRHNFAIAN
jgi:hypothetical protein